MIPPIPIPGVSKSLLPGYKKEKICFDDFDDFCEKSQKNHLPGGLTNQKISYLLRYDDFSSKTRKLRAGTPREEPGTPSFGPLAQECINKK